MSVREGTRRKKISVLHMLGTWEGKIDGCNCPSCKEWDVGERNFLTANKSPPKSPKGPKKVSIKVKTTKGIAKNNSEQVMPKQLPTVKVSKLPEELEHSIENVDHSIENEDLGNVVINKVIGSNCDDEKVSVEDREASETEEAEENDRLSGEVIVRGEVESEEFYKEEVTHISASGTDEPGSVQKKISDQNSLDNVFLVVGNRETQSDKGGNINDHFKIKQEPEEYFSDEEVIEKPVKKKQKINADGETRRSSKRAKMVTAEIENVYAKPRMIFTGRGVVRKFEPGLDRTPKSKRGRKPNKPPPPVKVKQEPKDTEPEPECEEEDGSDLDQLQRALSEAAENISDVGEEFLNAFTEFGEDPKKGGRPKRRSNPLFKRVDSDGDKYVECNMCFKMLKESSMKQHYKTHTGEKPHTCNECDARFTRKGDVERHKRLVHKNQKPYKCQKCNREFSDRKNLKAHLQNHDKAVYYACNTCGFKFGKREYYENHIRYIHPLPDGTRPAYTDNDDDLATKQLKQIEMEERREKNANNLDLAEHCDLIQEDEEEEECDKAMEITVSMGEEHNATASSSVMVKKEQESINTLSSQEEEMEDQGISIDSGREGEVVANLLKSDVPVGTDVKISKGTLSFTQTVPDTDSQDEDLVNKVIAAAVSQATNTIESLQAKSGGNMSGNDVDLVDDEEEEEDEEEEDEMLEGAEALQDILDSQTYDMLPMTQVQKPAQQPTEVHINASVSGQQRKFIIQVPPGTNLNVQTPEGMEMIVSIVNQLCAGKGELDGPIEVTMHNPNNRMVVMKKR